MATEGTSMQAHAASELDTAQLVKEHSQAFQNRLNTTKTDSEPSVDEAQPESPHEQSKGETGGDAPKTATDTAPPVAEPTQSPLGSAPIARESQISLGPKNETSTGEKRNIDSTVTSAPTLAADQEQEKSEPLEERDAKKLKTEERPIPDSNGASAGSTTTDNQSPKKGSRTKKEKIKDAVKKVIPGDSIGSRTRSRTKGA